MAEQSLPFASGRALPDTATTGLRRAWPHLALAAIAVLAGVLDFWALSQNGYGNAYYAAAVRSMLQSWHNFFYVSFDPTGFVTVDKPPVAFWLQALSARLFGFSSISLLAPSALAGVASVAVLGRTVARVWGHVAGLIAALILALTPVSLVANRSNDPDGILVLTLVLAAWAATRALQSGRLRWVVLTAVFVGLGFNTKMLAAYLVLPGLVVAYLVAGPRSWQIRLGHLGVAGLITLVLSGAWIAAVDLTPAGQRPWVDSTQTNSELSLATGYNGLGRIFGGFGQGNRGGAGARPPAGSGATAGGAGARPGGAGGPGGGAGGPGGGAGGPGGGAGGPGGGPGGARFGGPGGGMFGGQSGVTRLLTGSNAGQGSWLLPLAVVGAISALLAIGLRRRGPRLGSLVMFAGWLVVVWAIFSFSNGIFHPYYISEMAPAAAALVGIGAVSLWRDALSQTWRIGLPVVGLVGTAVFEATILNDYPGTLPGWDVALIVISIAGAVALLVWPLLATARRKLEVRTPAVVGGGLALGLVALLVAPTFWSSTVLASPTMGLGQAGPSQAPGGAGRAGARFGPGGFGGREQSSSSSQLLSFLESHAGATRYLLATTNSNAAAPLIIASGKNIIPLGGFSGSNPILTPSQLASLVQKGEIRYFLLEGGAPVPGQTQNQGRGPEQAGGFGGFMRGSSAATHVPTVCTAVPASEWGGTTSSPGQGRGGPGAQLYDCAGKGAALAAAASGSS